MIINQANLAALFVGFKALFNKGFLNSETYWEKIATMVPSTTSSEKYGWLGQWPGLRKWVGDRQIKNLKAHDYSIKNEPFESTVGVDRDHLDDDSFGIYSPMFEAMGQAAKTHPDELIFALLAAGFETLCYDGQYFFDTDHPVTNSNGTTASVSNMQAGAGAPWFLLDTRKPLKPLIFQKRKDYTFAAMTKEDNENVFMRKEYLYGIDARCNVGLGFWQQAFGSKATLDSTNFDAGYAAMQAFKSDEGRPLGVKASLLVVGPTNRANANAVIKAERLANGETNTNRNVVEVLEVPWLT